MPLLMLFSKFFEIKFLPSKATNVKFDDNLHGIFLQIFVIIRATIIGLLMIFHNAVSEKQDCKSD